MAIASMVLSGLALLAAAAAVCIAVNEKKRNQKRNAAAVDYIDAKCKELAATIQKLADGVVPDYEKARAAANAVNKFNDGISAILGFDPFQAYQKEKQREMMGGEVDE